MFKLYLLLYLLLAIYLEITCGCFQWCLHVKPKAESSNWPQLFLSLQEAYKKALYSLVSCFSISLPSIGLNL